jgi:hypothetical protein
VFKQVHQTWWQGHSPSRWRLKPLLWVVLAMAWCCGDAQDERFATARAVYVAAHQHERRPGTTLAGFLEALAQLPLPVLRAVAEAIRRQLRHALEALRLGSFLPVGCDGSRLECPRSEQLQRWLGEAGKPESPPMLYVTALVLLPVGLLWSWRLGKGTASELDHLCRLLPTLPERALIVADAFYLGYELYTAILQAGASFLMRMSSRACLYTLKEVPLSSFREGLVYYWPENMRERGKPPLLLRLLCVGAKRNVWLLTNVLDRRQLSRATAARLYRWRWRNEGLFRHYKRLLKKVKLYSRTVALVHREAEGSLLAMQLLLALAVPQPRGRGQTVLIADSPRRVLLRIRGALAEGLRQLGPRQFRQYQRLLEVVCSAVRAGRRSAKVRQDWPRRKPHKPPKPPKIRVMNEALKIKMAKVLNAV